MAKPKPSDILFWLLAALTMALLLSFVLVLVGAIPVESSSNAAATEETASTQAATVNGEAAPETTATTTTSTAPSETTTTQRVPAAPVSQLTNVVITASRGDCWISARRGSETGEVLDERLLEQGQSVRLQGPRVWLSVGASGNVDVSVNGKPRQLPAGTIEVVLGPTV